MGKYDDLLALPEFDSLNIVGIHATDISVEDWQCLYAWAEQAAAAIRSLEADARLGDEVYEEDGETLKADKRAFATESAAAQDVRLEQSQGAQPVKADSTSHSGEVLPAVSADLLPGLERAAEIDALEAEIHRIDYERMKMADALREILDYPLDSDVINAAAQMKFIAVRAFTSPIATEISRLKGEGRDHE